MTNKILNKIKANPHINVINKNLWVVNFDYVLFGWIKEIQFHDTTSDDCVAIAKDVIILNKNKKACSRMIPILKSIMKLPTEKIGKEESFCDWVRKDMPSLKKYTNEEIINFINENELNQVIKFYFQLSELEIKRRKEVKWNVKY